MDRNYKVLLATVVGGLTVALLPVTIAPLGLSSVLGLGLMSSVLLGSNVFSTTIFTWTVLGSGGSAIATSYSGALELGQVLVSLSAIGTLVFLEMSDSSYGGVRPLISEFRSSWKPIALIMVVLFAAIIAVRVNSIVN
jgi:hypothetical protein